MREQIEIPKSPLTDRQLKYGEKPKLMLFIFMVVVILSTTRSESVQFFGIDFAFSYLPDSILTQIKDFLDTTSN